MQGLGNYGVYGMQDRAWVTREYMECRAQVTRVNMMSNFTSGLKIVIVNCLYRDVVLLQLLLISALPKKKAVEISITLVVK